MISVGQKEVKPHPQPHPQPQAAQGGDDEFELSEEDLAAWAGSLVDDRQKKQGVCVWVWLLCVCGGWLLCVSVVCMCVWVGMKELHIIFYSVPHRIHFTKAPTSSKTSQTGRLKSYTAID